MRSGLVAASGAPEADNGQPLLVALDGVHCAGCVQRLHRALPAEVVSCEVDLATKIATMTLDSRRTSIKAILGGLKRSGFAPRLISGAALSDADTLQRRRRAVGRIGLALICAMQVMMLAWPDYFSSVPDTQVAELMRWGQFLIATPAVFIAGWPFLSAAASALSARTLTMDVPVAASITIAYSVSVVRVIQGQGLLYFDAATMFVALLLLGRYLESGTRAKASARIKALLGAQVSQALRVTPHGLQSVAVSALRENDLIQVPSGEALAVDGRLESDADLDESLLTGESRPMARRSGALAYAGSLNLSPTALRLRVAACGDRTRLAGLLRLLQRAAARKPTVQRIADRVAAHFTLAVLLLATAGAIYGLRQGTDVALVVVISVLIASCPCALSLAVPAVLASASSRLASQGVLLTRVDRLLRLRDVDTVIFDKTGTLTHARLEQRALHLLGAKGREQVMRIAAALEAGLPHPIARALSTGAHHGLVQNLKVRPGHGVSGTVDGQAYWIGPAPSPGHTDDALTWVRLQSDDGPLADFGLAPTLRDEAAQVVGKLKSAGIEVELLSGDALAASRQIADQLGIKRLAARQTPEQKLFRLRQLQQAGRVVLAIGDGLNDAPLLAAADVSAAMPAGSAATQAGADLIFLNDRLDGLLLASKVADAAHRRMWQNMIWAIAYNLSVLPLAFTANLLPWMAAAGMSLSSLLVVSNALRMPKAT